MNFTFPESKVLKNGTIKNHSITRNGKIFYESIDINNPLSNLISIDKVDYYFTYLDITGKNKGGNSTILKLYETQNINIQDIEYQEPDLVIKILKYKIERFPSKSEKRFKKEIKALIECNKAASQNIINIDKTGVCKIYNPFYENYEEFLFYTMEFAQYDLKNYIETYHKNLKLEEKLDLCINLAKGLKELNFLGYFHRDLKPDNLFISNGKWKIGDLGLLGERDDSNTIDNENEPIGPRGWMSPESMNKYLTENKGFINIFNCKIDHQSDIFQLGKIFWYIFQHNAPIGTIKESDFRLKNTQIYSIIKTMLNHSKSKRYESIDEVITLLEKIDLQLFKSVSI